MIVGYDEVKEKVIGVGRKGHQTSPTVALVGDIGLKKAVQEAQSTNGLAGQAGQAFKLNRLR